MENKEDKTETKLNLVVPEDMAEFYITGGAIASTPTDIRLILFSDELLKDDNVLGSKVDLIKTAKTEIIMHPNVAKQIRDLIDSELKKYVNE